MINKKYLKILDTLGKEKKDIITNLVVMAIGFAIFGVVIFATMMLYEWLGISTEGYIW